MSTLHFELFRPNVLAVLVALALTRLNRRQRTRRKTVVVALVPTPITELLDDKPAVFCILLHGGAYGGFRNTELARQVRLRGNTQTLVWAWVSERLTVGTLLGRANNQVSYAGEDRFGRALVLVQVTVKHREIFSECHD